MKAKFTEGPWETVVYDAHGRFSIQWAKGCIEENDYITKEEMDANAALIADTPTLLNVLSKCYATLAGEYPKDQWEEYYPDILEAKALLEKHLGEGWEE